MNRKTSLAIVLTTFVLLLFFFVRKNEEQPRTTEKLIEQEVTQSLAATKSVIPSALASDKLESIAQIATHISKPDENFDKHETVADPQEFKDLTSLRSLRDDLLQNKVDRTSEVLRKNLFNLVQTPNLVWTVRREAARALFAMAPIADETERLKMMAEIDKRILQVAQMTDDELFDQVVNYAAR